MKSTESADSTAEHNSSYFSFEAAKQKIAELILSTVQSVIERRSKYYYDPAHSKPRLEDIPRIIEHCAVLNAIISGSLAIIPGWGSAVASLPELVVLFKNQSEMIYDIGVAHNQESKISSELVLQILISSVSPMGYELGMVQGGKFLIKRSSLRVMQSICKAFGARVLQQTIKSALPRMIPIVGSAILGSWSHFTTKKIGKEAINIFEKEIIEETSPSQEPNIPDPSEEEIQREEDAFFARNVNTYFAVMMADGLRKEEEIKYILAALDDQNIPTTDKEAIASQLRSGDFAPFDIQSAKDEGKDSCVKLMTHLVGIAKSDAEFHPKERELIQSIGHDLGFSDQDIQEFYGETPDPLKVEGTRDAVSPPIPEPAPERVDDYVHSIDAMIMIASDQRHPHVLSVLESLGNIYSGLIPFQRPYQKTNRPTALQSVEELESILQAITNGTAIPTPKGVIIYDFDCVIVSILIGDPLNLMTHAANLRRGDRAQNAHADASSANIEYLIDTVFKIPFDTGRLTSSVAQNCVKRAKKNAKKLE
jgi:uncharacterized tellurite resistance protein B-like protein